MATSCHGRASPVRQPVPVLVPVFVHVHVLVPVLCLSQCQCSSYRLLSEMYTHIWSRLLGSDKGLPTAQCGSSVIPYPDRLTPSTTTTWDTCARQTIRQHGNLYCSVAARMATRSETSQRDDADLLMAITCSDLWRRQAAYHPSLLFSASNTGKVEDFPQPRTRPPWYTSMTEPFLGPGI